MWSFKEEYNNLRLMDVREKVIIDAATKAGKALLKFDPTTMDTQRKTSVGDYVTAADLKSEKIIKQVIYAAYPNDLIISEESSEGHEKLTPENLATLTGWVTDPLDGTNNFKHEFAYSAVSIGYIEHGEPVLGAVYNPFREELYIARKGSGATRNGQPIHVADKISFDEGTRVCTSNTYGGGTLASLATYTKLGDVWVDVLGSAVLIITDVASGRLDLFYHNGLKPWDNAAAFLIAEEAGAKITDLSGKPTNWLTSDVVIGNDVLVDEFIARTTS
jgi:myo-inositol-1(or 4)-monophosphatase